MCRCEPRRGEQTIPRPSITSHPGTPDGRWQCACEFTAPGHDQTDRRYQWILLGLQTGAIFDSEAPNIDRGSDVATLIAGSSTPRSGPAIPVPGESSCWNGYPSLTHPR